MLIKKKYDGRSITVLWTFLMKTTCAQYKEVTTVYSFPTNLNLKMFDGKTRFL